MNTKIGMMLALSLMVGSSAPATLEEIQAKTCRRAACGNQVEVFYCGNTSFLTQYGTLGGSTIAWTTAPQKGAQKMASTFVYESQLDKEGKVMLSGLVNLEDIIFYAF